MRLFLPIILVVAAIGLFIVYTNPTYQNATKILSPQLASYNDALSKSAQLRALRDQLLSKRNTFEASDVQKLQEVLPDNVDNIRLIIDINNIAARHNLSLSKVNLGDVMSNTQTKNAAVINNAASPTGSVEIGFSVAASYDNLQAFLQDLEHSLRLIDVEKLSFHASQGDQNTYDFVIRTYWLH